MRLYLDTEVVLLRQAIFVRERKWWPRDRGLLFARSLEESEIGVMSF